MRRIDIWPLAAFFVAIPFAAQPSTLRVVPTTVLFNEQDTTAALKITNEGTNNMAVQVGAKLWDQDALGVDGYSETSDIVFFPRIIDVEAGKEQIIRIGYQGDRTLIREKSYRIFLQELPVSKPGTTALKFAITFSIPIFVEPKEVQRGLAIEQVDQVRGQLNVKVTNNGNSHVVLKAIRVKGIDATGGQTFAKEVKGWYLLSDRSRTYEILIPEDGCIQANEIEITVQSSDDVVAISTESDPDRCQATGKSRRAISN